MPRWSATILTERALEKRWSTTVLTSRHRWIVLQLRELGLDPVRDALVHDSFVELVAAVHAVLRDALGDSPALSDMTARALPYLRLYVGTRDLG